VEREAVQAATRAVKQVTGKDLQRELLDEENVWDGGPVALAGRSHELELDCSHRCGKNHTTASSDSELAVADVHCCALLEVVGVVSEVEVCTRVLEY
jgi:hypothetical protein